MRLMRCRICGDTYLGTEAPSRCPFCGADARYIVDPDKFSASENDVPVTEIERADLQTAIELERSNARFYAAIATLPGHEALSSAYKRLSSIEAEHCSVFCQLAGQVKPDDLKTPEGDPSSWCDAIAESAARERRAADFYAAALSRSTNARIAEVFAAISAVEEDHLVVDALAAAKAHCA